MKNVFEVTIRETLERRVKVEVASKEEAEDIIRQGWRNGDHVLGADDFTDVEFSANRILARQREYER